MIETTAELAAACETLASGDYLTIDTEFLRETTFWPQLCLIQMAGPDIAVIVDPMAKDIDLAPFFALMANTDVVKVFHAARQDIPKGARVRPKCATEPGTGAAAPAGSNS